MVFTSEQFEPGEAWLVFPTDINITDQTGRLFFLVDVASVYVYGHVFIEENPSDAEQVNSLMMAAYKMKDAWPKKIFFPLHNTAEPLFKDASKRKDILFEVTSLSKFSDVVAELKASFRMFQNEL